MAEFFSESGWRLLFLHLQINARSAVVSVYSLNYLHSALYSALRKEQNQEKNIQLLHSSCSVQEDWTWNQPEAGRKHRLLMLTPKLEASSSLSGWGALWWGCHLLWQWYTDDEDQRSSHQKGLILKTNCRRLRAKNLVDSQHSQEGNERRAVFASIPDTNRSKKTD